MMGGSWLAATLPVLDLAVMSVEAVRSAAVAAGATGAITTEPVDPERVAAAFSSDRLLRIGGRPVDGFAPLSGFFEAADGWVRTHGNYPHHADRLGAMLGLDRPDRSAVAEAIRARPAEELETAAAECGAVLVRVRTEEEWWGSEPGQAAASGPLVSVSRRDDVGASTLHGAPTLHGGRRPLAGIRVLDLTRVIAGPVCTRNLALLGAEVLRVDPPGMPEIGWQHLDTGQGKRSTLVDLGVDRGVAQGLLDEADVLVTGYRPGSIERHGLRLPPGAVHARISAWGDAGPWSQRRGFDSIVQAASGIAMVESADGGTPGALPAQALDHASGYLLAAAVIEALVARADDGSGRDISVALARTAAHLLDAAPRTPGHGAAVTPTATVAHGDVVTARPAVPGFDDYPSPARPWGVDPPAWG